MSSSGNFLEDIVNVVTQVSTAGLVGYEGGKIGAGVTTKESFNVVKELTGASAAEDANKAAEKNLREQKALAEQDRKEQTAQHAKEQLIASKQAGGARRSTSKKASAKGSIAPKAQTNLGSDEQDFLGL